MPIIKPIKEAIEDTLKTQKKEFEKNTSEVMD
jgi:hypothetical protein